MTVMDLVHPGVGNHLLYRLDPLGDRSRGWIPFCETSGVILLARIGPRTV